MPYADNQGVGIHYEVEGEGPPLVLCHGWSGRLERCRDNGYVDALQTKYKLVEIHARGHGNSDKLYELSSYGTDYMAMDVLSVMDKLSIASAHFFGYSMGGRTGFALSRLDKGRFLSMIILGMHPYKIDRIPGDPRIEMLKRGIGAFVESIEAQQGPMDPVRRASQLENDPEALIASVSGMTDSIGLEDVLPEMTMPCLICVGDEDGNHDQAMEAVKFMPHASFLSMPRLNHQQSSRRSDLLLPHILKFLSGELPAQRLD